MILNYHFPTPIWWEDTKISTSSMLKLAYGLRKHDPEGRKISNQNGWQSKDILPNTFLQLAFLEKEILKNATNCFIDYGYRLGSRKIVIDNLWFNINSKGCANRIHTHPTAFISGVFYIKASENQGNISFHRNYLEDCIINSQAEIEEYNPLTFSAMSFEPITGKLLMFPGYLPHGVDVNNTDEDRVSLAFNVKLTSC